MRRARGLGNRVIHASGSYQVDVRKDSLLVVLLLSTTVVMDRIAFLARRADLLGKRIYASIPFSDRLADLFVKISLDTIETIAEAWEPSS